MVKFARVCYCVGTPIKLMPPNSSQPPQVGSKNPKPNHLLVAIITTSGSYPAVNFDEVPNHQPLDVMLKAAVRELGITDTAGWLAKNGLVQLDPAKSYLALGLSGEVSIDYGPPASGGGHE